MHCITYRSLKYPSFLAAQHELGVRLARLLLRLLPIDYMSPNVSWGVPKRLLTPLLTQGAHENFLGDDWGEWQVRALYGSSHFQLAIPIQPLPIDYMSPQRQLGGVRALEHPPTDVGGS